MSKQDDSIFVHFLKQMVSGGGAGAISRTLMAPLERTKVLLQVQDVAQTPAHLRYKGMMDCLVRIPKEQGIKAYWRGNGVNVARMIPNSAIKFSTYDMFKKTAFPNGEAEFEKKPTQLFLRKMICGGLSGVSTIIPVYPMDLARTRLTADVGSPRQYKGLFDCLHKTAQSEGPRGLYKGIGISLCGIIPYLAISLSMYDSLKLYTRDKSPFWQSPIGKVLLGSIAAILSQTIAYPLDTVRRHMQVSGGLGQQKLYTGTWDCITKIYKKNGIRGFYKGLVANAVRAAPQAGIEYAVYDWIASFIADMELNTTTGIATPNPVNTTHDKFIRRMSSDVDKVERAFDSIDKHGKGYISVVQLEKALLSIGYSEWEINRVIENNFSPQHDLTKERMDFLEFRKLCKDQEVMTMLERLSE